MKNCIISAMLLIAFTLTSQGGTRVSYIDSVTGGTVTFTNSTDYSYELKSVMFTVSDAVLTNVFTISPIRPFRLPDTLTTEVVTNTMTGDTSMNLTTNTLRYAGGMAWVTNALVVATTTNVVTTQFYDWDDFGEGLMFEPYDEQKFTFTSTNALYLIRVYDVYNP